MYKNFVKCALDVLLSAAAIAVLALPMLAIVVAIKVNDPGPAVFSQKRVGKNKKTFTLYKFRSMKVNTPDIPTHLLAEPEKYITKVGAFLRRTSLDELPQLFNIITLRMSIVGPRPALWNQDDLIAQRDKYGANGVRPGLTGWAQINGRDELEIPEKARLDGEYVKKMSFVFDLKCILSTVRSVFRGDGIVEGGTGRMKK